MYHFNLSTRFRSISERHANRPALRMSHGNISYAQISRRAGALAGLLSAKGLQTGHVVGIASTKQADTYAMMLACLQLGITYVNLDVTSPEDRLKKICSTCKPALIYADHDAPVFEHLAGKLEVAYIGPDISTPEDFVISETCREKIDGATIAYIMYTSGSTGIPKGVAVTHQNLLHFIDWSISCYEVTPEDNFANLSPLYFDNSVFDFYTTFFSGASLTPVPRDVLNHPKKLIDFVTDMRCTVWFSVPSLLVYLLNMKVLSGKKLSSIRVFSFGGEGFPKTELHKLYKMYAPRVRFINVYGPTECTCICSNWNITEQDFADMNCLAPLGRLNPNFSCIIIGDSMQPDSQGELYLLGPNVSAGYYNDPERSAAVFGLCEHHPHVLKPQYKTGDLVRLEDGILYFMGRKDNQIKHMGYRIELEEIEAALNSLPGVGQGAVVYQRVQAAYGKIVAYVAPEQPAATPLESSDIKKKMEALLPPYMIPNKVIMLDQLPKNANGKVDRALLTAGIDG